MFAAKSQNRRVALRHLEATTARSKCMGCDEPPTHECIWADGRGRAWFCDTHWKKFQGEHKDIVKSRNVPNGIVGPKYNTDPPTKKADADDGKKTGDGHGVGLFIPLPREIAAKFPPKSEEDLSDQHVTFLYVGQVEPHQEQALLDAVRHTFSTVHGPMRASLGEVEHFTHPEKERQVAVLDIRFSHGMAELRWKLRDNLIEAGFDVADSFPLIYRPHTTLAYLDGLDAQYDGPVPRGWWEFNEIEVWGLPKLHAVPFGEPLQKVARVASRAIAAGAHARSIALMKFLARTARGLRVGEHVYVVGGAVRNFIIDRPIKDIDVVIDAVNLGRGRDSAWFAKKVGEAIPAATDLTTNQYGVAILTVKDEWVLEGEDLNGEVIEIANARKESYGGGEGKGYKPHMVEPATIEEDTVRREFTVNTLLWRLHDLANGPDQAEILDLTGCGRKDLQEGWLRCPTDPDKVFADDPSRMVRAVKFLTKYGLKISPEVRASITKNKDKLKQVPPSHLSNMLINTFLRDSTGPKALRELDKLGLLDVVKEIAQKDKAFREALAGWADRESKVDFLFTLMDFGLPSGKRLGFLDRVQQQRVREIAVDMSHDDADAFVRVLAQPGKALNMKALIDESGFKGREISRINDAARQVLLGNPALVVNQTRLMAAIRQNLGLGRQASRVGKSFELNIGDPVLTGKYLNSKGYIVEFGKADGGDPTVVVETVPDKDGKTKKKTVKVFKLRYDESREPRQAAPGRALFEEGDDGKPKRTFMVPDDSLPLLLDGGRLNDLVAKVAARYQADQVLRPRLANAALPGEFIQALGALADKIAYNQARSLGDTSDLWVVWRTFYYKGQAWAQYVIDTLAIPAKAAKSIEMGARVFRVSYGRGKGPRPSIAGWFAKHERHFRVLREATQWPERTEGEGVFEHGPFRVHNTIGASDREMQAAKAVIDRALRAIPKTEVSELRQVAYGDLYLVGQIKRKNWAAWYMPQKDAIYLRPKMRGISADDVALHLVHELGHRLWKKKLPADVKKAWQTHHFTMAMSKGGLGRLPEAGEVLPEVLKINNKQVRVEEYDERGYAVLIDAKKGEPVGTVDRIKLREWMGNVEHVGKFPSIYAASDAEEHFCESLAHKGMGSLDETNKAAFDSIVLGRASALTERVAFRALERMARAAPGSKGQKSIKQGRFVIWYLPRYEADVPVVQEGLKRAEAKYAQAKYRLPDNIPVLMAARPFGSMRSIYSSANGGFIQLVPSAFDTKAEFHTFIHELAHYVHAHQIPGGFRNPLIAMQFSAAGAAESQNPSAPTEDPLEKAKANVAQVEKMWAKVAGLFRKGQRFTVNYEDYFSKAKSQREVEIIKRTSRGRKSEFTLKWLELTPEEVEMRILGTTKPLVPLVRMMVDPAQVSPKLGPGVEAMLEWEKEAFEAYNEAVIERSQTPEARYEKHLAKWFPTSYSQTNPQEWFAELVTARVLSPSSMDPEVADWIDALMRTGRAPKMAGSDSPWTPSRVHDLADSLGVPWDDDPEFMALSKEVTGKEHLDDMTPRELEATAQALRGLARVAAKFQKKKEVPKAKGKGTTTVYEYSERQVALRNREKAKRVEKLRGSIGKLRSQYKKDLTAKDEKVRYTALAVALIDDTYERVGNEGSAKDGHFGVTGWRKKHLTFSDGKATISYVGKSGVKQKKVVEDASLVSALKKATDGKGPDAPLCEGEDCRIEASDVNEYLKPFDVTAKDLRGFHANTEMQRRLKAIRSSGGKLPEDKKKRDEKLKAEFDKALGESAEAVGHEASTLRSQYLVPGLEEEYLKDGQVSEKLNKQGLCARVARRFLATKTKGEVEEEEAERLIKPMPKKKPPRHDLKRRKVEDEDTEDEDLGADGDRDLSLNYKRLAWEVAARFLEAAGKPERKPGDVYQGKSGWVGVNPGGESHSFPEKEQAEAFAKGVDAAEIKEKGGGEPKDPGDKAKGKKDQKDKAQKDKGEADEKAKEEAKAEREQARTEKQLRSFEKALADAGADDVFANMADEDKVAAAADYAAKLKDLKADFVAGEHLADMMEQAHESLTSPIQGNASAVAEALAEREFARKVLVNPTLVGGTKTNSEPKTPEELRGRAVQAFDQFVEASPEVRAEAATQMAKKLQGMKDGPEKDELESLLDGMVLAAAVNGEDLKIPGGKKGKHIRPPLPATTRRLAQQLYKSGQHELLLQPVDELHSPEGREIVQQAMSAMDDQALGEFAGGSEGPRGALVKLLDDSEMGEEQKAFVRETLQMMATNQMTSTYAFLSAAVAEKEGKEGSEIGEAIREAEEKVAAAKVENEDLAAEMDDFAKCMMKALTQKEVEGCKEAQLGLIVNDALLEGQVIEDVVGKLPENHPLSHQQRELAETRNPGVLGTKYRQQAS